MAVWGDERESPSHETMTQSALRAAMHPNKKCLVVDLLYGWVKHVEVEDPNAFLSMIK